MFSSEDIEGYHIDAEQVENRFNQRGLSQICETIRTLRVCVRKELNNGSLEFKLGRVSKDER